MGVPSVQGAGAWGPRAGFIHLPPRPQHVPACEGPCSRGPWPVPCSPLTPPRARSRGPARSLRPETAARAPARPRPAPPRAPPPLPAPAGARAAPRPLAAPEEGGPFLFAPDIPLVRSVLPAAERRGGAVPLAPLSPHPSSPPAPSPPRSAPAGGTGADGASPSVSPGVSSVPQQQQQRLAG